MGCVPFFLRTGRDMGWRTPPFFSSFLGLPRPRCCLLLAFRSFRSFVSGSLARFFISYFASAPKYSFGRPPPPPPPPPTGEALRLDDEEEDDDDDGEE